MNLLLQMLVYFFLIIFILILSPCAERPSISVNRLNPYTIQGYAEALHLITSLMPHLVLPQMPFVLISAHPLGSKVLLPLCYRGAQKSLVALEVHTLSVEGLYSQFIIQPAAWRSHHLSVTSSFLYFSGTCPSFPCFFYLVSEKSVCSQDN